MLKSVSVPPAEWGWVERCRVAGVCQQTGPSQCLNSERTHRQTWPADPPPQKCKQCDWTPAVRFVIRVPFVSFSILIHVISYPTVANSVYLCHPGCWAVWGTRMAIQRVNQELKKAQPNWEMRLNSTEPQRRHRHSIQKHLLLRNQCWPKGLGWWTMYDCLWEILIPHLFFLSIILPYYLVIVLFFVFSFFFVP